MLINKRFALSKCRISQHIQQIAERVVVQHPDILHWVRPTSFEKKITPWLEDTGTITLLLTLLTEDEFKRIREPQIQAMSKVTALIEYKILKEATRLISGEATADVSIEQSLRVAQAVDEAKKTN